MNIGDERTLKTYLLHLENAGIIRTLHKEGKSLKTLDKPEKLYLDNPNLMYALSGNVPDTGSIRETFFLSCFPETDIVYPDRGDFRIDKNLFVIGGPNKDSSQIANIADAYLALDKIEIGSGNRIPLWLFGFLF